MLTSLNINARIYSADRVYLGRLAYLIVSQENGKLAKFVVKKGFFDNDLKVVDLEAVAKINETGGVVKLNLNVPDYRDLPALTIYEESKMYSYSPELQNYSRNKLHTRLVTYLPDSVFEKEEETARPDHNRLQGRSQEQLREENEESQVAGRFMQRIMIYTDKFVLLGGKSILNVIDKAKNGILSKVWFNRADGKIETINLRQGLPLFSFLEFQVPFKLSNLTRLDKASPQYY